MSSNAWSWGRRPREEHPRRRPTPPAGSRSRSRRRRSRHSSETYRSNEVSRARSRGTSATRAGEGRMHSRDREVRTPSPSPSERDSRRKAWRTKETGAAASASEQDREAHSPTANASTVTRRARQSSREKNGHATGEGPETRGGKPKIPFAQRATPAAKKKPPEKPAPGTRTRRKVIHGSAGEPARALLGGEANAHKLRTEKTKEAKRDEEKEKETEKQNQSSAGAARPARGNEQSASPASRTALQTLARQDDEKIQAEFWASVLVRILQLAPRDLDLRPEIKRMKEHDFRGSGHYNKWMRVPVAEAPAEAMCAFHGTTWDGLACIKNGVQPGPRQAGRKYDSWMNDAAPGGKVAFASRNFCDAMNYVGPTAVRSCSAKANVMIVLGVYQIADHWEVSGMRGDSTHALQALEWKVSHVYVRAWGDTHAEDIQRSVHDKDGRFNWDNSHDHRAVLDPRRRDWNIALRYKAELANRITEGRLPMGSHLFEANPILERQTLRGENDAAATTIASGSRRRVPA